MKKLLFIIVALMVAVGAFADNQQAGYVKTRGRLDANGNLIPGQRLGSATVVLQGGSSVATDNNGDFVLKTPSTKFYLKDVKKNGYIVSDPDILSKQYACSANPLILVLETPSTQQADKRESEDKLFKKLRKQLREREDELDALREEHKITQEQYQETLQKLYSDQESNVKFIAEMADRYSKIDFDQLDDFQRQMAALIRNGELARADSLLRTKGSMENREAEIKRLQQANAKEREELALREANLSKSEKNEEVLLADFAADCYSHFELCKLKFENDSAAYWLEKRAALFPENIDYQHEAGDFMRVYLANYSLALDYYNKALALAIDRDGEGTQSVASCYINIGNVYYDQGEYAKALEYYEKALNIRLGIFGEKHPEVATCYGNIGNVYSDQGEYAKALEHYEKALDICLGFFGENHPDVAINYDSIGLAYAYQGEYAKALEYCEKALKIHLGLFGENHPDVAINYNNIGGVYSYQGEYAKASENLEKALNIKLGIFGENHPAVACSLHNIGVVYDAQGEYAKALEYYEKALNIQLGIFGENHPDVAGSYYSIGTAYYSLGEYTKSLNNLEKALNIWLEIFDENHPYVKNARTDITQLKEIMESKNQ